MYIDESLTSEWLPCPPVDFSLCTSAMACREGDLADVRLPGHCRTSPIFTESFLSPGSACKTTALMCGGARLFSVACKLYHWSCQYYEPSETNQSPEQHSDKIEPWAHGPLFCVHPEGGPHTACFLLVALLCCIERGP